MNNNSKKNKNRKFSLTLVEFIIFILLGLILSASVYKSVNKYLAKSEIRAMEENAMALYASAKTYTTSNSTFITLDNLYYNNTGYYRDYIFSSPELTKYLAKDLDVVSKDWKDVFYLVSPNEIGNNYDHFIKSIDKGEAYVLLFRTGNDRDSINSDSEIDFVASTERLTELSNIFGFKIDCSTQDVYIIVLKDKHQELKFYLFN